MNRSGRFYSRSGFLIAFAILLQSSPAHAQGERQQGRTIGTIATQGNLIVMELNKDVLGKANLFDLAGRTLRFTPDGKGYRAANLALQWDPDFGREITGSEVTLRNFEFPYSGKKWDSFVVGRTGTITFGASAPPSFGRYGGFSVGRFDQLAEAAGALVNTAPAISVFLKPRMSGPRYVKELKDRVVITWNLTEPWGGIQDFTWKPTVNRFQAVLGRDGSIEMSYDQLAARDAIVGLYPMITAGAERALATIQAADENTSAAPNLDVRNLKVAVVGGLFLKVTFETRGPVLPEGDPGIDGISYSAHLASPNTADADVVWTVHGFGGRRSGATSRYVAFGPGVSHAVKTNGNTISLQGILPPQFKGLHQLAVSAEVMTPGNPATVTDRIPVHEVTLSGLWNPEVHLSSLTPHDGPFPILYEAFHYLALPNMRDLTCTVIGALGDKFDFLPYYSDFRIDNQEAGTPSDGPLGGHVTGIGAPEERTEDYCSAGRFQWQFIQPVYVGANQMQEYPPEGVKTGNTHDIDFYARQLGEALPDGRMPPYNYAMSQIGHEMGHRWAAFVSAKVNGETIPLGPTHWARGLQAPVAFPYERPTEASNMGGGVWQDNFDGTFTQLDDDYYVPATGHSYLDLYLMGLIAPAEVPDFFILRNLVPAGKDANGHPIFKADRTKVTIQDVIAAEGPRLPDVYHSQKQFNTGMVLVVEHGAKPSPELIERVNGIRKAWIDYWSTTSGHRSTMTANPG